MNVRIAGALIGFADTVQHRQERRADPAAGVMPIEQRRALLERAYANIERGSGEKL